MTAISAPPTQLQGNTRVWFEKLNIPHQLNVPLAPLTWYGVGGPARILAKPASVEQLRSLLTAAAENTTPVYILGAGANLLVSDEGVNGVVVVLNQPAFKSMAVTGHRLVVGAGYSLERLVLETTRQGLAGIECMAGIPASIGGAIRMNAGGAYGEIGPRVARVKVMERSGTIRELQRTDLAFSYRKSNIGDRIVLEAEFELTPDDTQRLDARRREIHEYKKSTQPLADHSAGCAFKNPPPKPDGEKQSAGKLVDLAGLKGFRIGGAQVSPQHGNFITADKNVTRAADILSLMQHVQRVVQDKFGVPLEREVVVWP